MVNRSVDNRPLSRRIREDGILEPFLGSGAIFFNKKPSAVETINDLDGDIVNLFQVLRENPEELKRVLSLTPYSREEYDNSFVLSEDPMERARRYMIRTTQAIGAKMAGSSKCGWRNHKQMKIGGTACKWGNITETIDAAATRLRGNTRNLVQIEKMDALRLIERYNSQDVLIYIDPPYLRSTRKSGALYRHEMDRSGHIALLKIISESRAKIIISGYDNDLYNEKLTGWTKEKTMSQTTSTQMAEETIWMNFDKPERQCSIAEFGKEPLT